MGGDFDVDGARRGAGQREAAAGDFQRPRRDDAPQDDGAQGSGRLEIAHSAVPAAAMLAVETMGATAGRSTTSASILR